ncbi:hypothetical protein [Alteribacter aurantiacus]|uniref:hypothetical protein n=1 Tax=Alteribacter aurantiacus TaxID=254410 RepID=UPI0003FB331B|nr:hypothetical protein [Alteribacter aurantiacus]
MSWHIVRGKQKYIILYEDYVDITKLVRELCFHRSLLSLINVGEPDQLASILNKELMGTYIYLSLKVKKTREVLSLLYDLGFSPLDLQVVKEESERAIFCAHCHTVFITDDHPHAVCEKCNITLSVTNHWSTFHHAFLGSFEFEGDSL